ncbi:UL12 protein [Gallid alphaherpesvirus 3]|uniref:UL12 protein n=2 Tax=Gallid alphaherpesvirus 3 TaxID=35250 RepID=Q782T4_9ALPH|nr:deoxyribonuclease [Gallid alphaherpesvirus 3]YP_010795605.1 UL12-like protein [Gallid alphaherpesvirus 3]BAA82906.1 UL12 product homolog [Marek's disease virus serotype 2 MDV2]AEI00214.1 UL12-like protein [Gallid alphaherpesvirus 3]QEY02235.1 UL12-like protein [Gallid alphaherpesvirus 3]BAB16520.1 UL12 protein [Gallid alphaherpesvirus 3]
MEIDSTAMFRLGENGPRKRKKESEFKSCPKVFACAEHAEAVQSKPYDTVCYSVVVDYTFSDYILRNVDPKQSGPSPHPLYHRLLYITDVIKRGISEGRWPASSYSSLLEAEDKLLYESGANATSPSNHALFWCKIVETLTRPQADCELWHVLRQWLLTASTLKWTADGRINTVGIRPAEITAQGMPESVVFGTRNEPLARALIETYCLENPRYRPREPSRVLENARVPDETITVSSASDKYACGLMIDARTGMLGASLDMAVCPRSARGILTPALPDHSIETYEIKCRAKYAFYPECRSELSQCYERLLQTRTVAALRRFLYAINHPCVDYFKPDDFPKAKEALITCDDDWKVGLSRFRAISSNIKRNDFDSRHLASNKNCSSRVWLFGEPDLQTNAIHPLCWSTGEQSVLVPIFANPRHPNFKQIFVQNYVASNYFESNPVIPHLATFIGRRRRPGELGRRLTISEGNTGEPTPSVKIDPEQAIPVLLLITPVVVDVTFYGEVEEAGYRAFGELVQQVWAKQYP